MQKAQEQMRKQVNKHCRNVAFNVNDLVLLNNTNLKFKQLPCKLQRRFVGPFQIIEKINNVAYKLKLPEGWKIHNVFHISLLKPYKASRFYAIGLYGLDYPKGRYGLVYFFMR